MQKYYQNKIYIVRTIDIEKELDERLSAMAVANGRSKRDVVNYIIEKGLALEEAMK